MQTKLYNHDRSWTQKTHLCRASWVFELDHTEVEANPAMTVKTRLANFIKGAALEAQLA